MHFKEFTKQHGLQLDKKVEQAISVQIGIGHKQKMWVMAITPENKLIWLKDIKPEAVVEALEHDNKVIIISSNVAFKTTLINSLGVDLHVDNKDKIFWIVTPKVEKHDGTGIN